MFWREIQRKNFTNLLELLKFLEISDIDADLFMNLRQFPLNLPLRLAEKIKKNDLSDPLLLQFLPQKLENQSQGGKIDPVEDTAFQKTSCMLQKYAKRALLVTTSACAMHCRYCFRKNYPYEITDFANELKLIQEDPSLEEVLLSGGDPLSLSDEKLFKLLDELDKIEHLKRIRFHTRFIIGIPERIHDDFILKLQSLKKQLIFVVHINHVNELDNDIFLALKKLQRLGIPVLTQTVLLRGVNNSSETLAALFNALINQGIMPYYLHQFDPVEGSMHFEVNIDDGKRIYQELLAMLPGYAVPKYVQEIPHKQSKTPVV
jgi:EF-P beta-lysylation protein EpmB